MAEMTLQDMLEFALRRISETPDFQEIARICPYSELHFQIHAGRYAWGDVRIKGRGRKEDSWN